MSLKKLSKDVIDSLWHKYLYRDPYPVEYERHENKTKKDLESELILCREREAVVSSPRVAVLISGHPRDMSFYSNLVPLVGKKVDFFVFSWDQPGKRGTETELENSEQSYRDEIEKIYKSNFRIKKYAIENNKDFVKNNPVDPSIKFIRYSRSSEVFIKSQLYAIKRSYQLMEEYVKETGIKYDLVLKTRNETIIKKFIVDDELIKEVNKDKIIFVPHAGDSGHGHPHPSYCERCDQIYEFGLRMPHIFDHRNAICDLYAYGSMESMKKYCYAIDSYEETSRKFEKHNMSMVDRLPIEYTKDGEAYVFDHKSYENDVILQMFMFCSYPEKLFQYLLKDHMLVKARKIVLGWVP